MIATAPDGLAGDCERKGPDDQPARRGQKEFKRALRRLPLQGELQRLANGLLGQHSAGRHAEVVGAGIVKDHLPRGVTNDHAFLDIFERHLQMSREHPVARSWMGLRTGQALLHRLRGPVVRGIDDRPGGTFASRPTANRELTLHMDRRGSLESVTVVKIHRLRIASPPGPIASQDRW